MEISRLLFALTIAGLALLMLPGAVPQAFSEVGISINIGPPPVVVAEPPEVVLIPDSRVYYVPDPELDVFFYSGYWYSPRGNRWYRARAYNGPWVLIGRSHVPGQVIRVPRDYRDLYEDEDHIPYGQWKKHWRKHRHGHDRDDDD